MNLNWKRFPEATHYTPAADGHYSGFWKMEGDTAVKLWCQELAGGEFAEYDNPTMFEADRARLIARPAGWDGLPPVGTVCEFEVETNDWRQCEVIAIKDDYAVCWIHVNKIFATGGAAIRPLRTPEQIAAEEREAGIKAMLDAITQDYGADGVPWWSRLGLLYDAGYRKKSDL